MSFQRKDIYLGKNNYKPKRNVFFGTKKLKEIRKRKMRRG